MLNRRFIRLQAVQQLYAFYVCKRANRAWALDQIRDDFIPDFFADPHADKDQLAQEAQQAADLFKSSLATLETAPSDLAHASRQVNASVSRALASYKNELAKDRHRLVQGLATARATMNQACVRIWQLLVEWRHIAIQQAERPKLAHPDSMTASACLADSCLLQRLQQDSTLASLVQQEAAGWEAHMPLVESWYNQFVKKDPTVQAYLAGPSSLAQEQQLLEFLVEDIIFSKKAIQEFFSGLVLNWDAQKRLVKKLVHQGLVHVDQNSEKSPRFEMIGMADQWEVAQGFYTDLIHRTLQKEEELEALIAQKSANWTVERIMLLDKTILKLALCEMVYFPAIPVKVSINEYIEIAKTYGVLRSSQFVNGLLDAVAATLHQGGITDRA